MKNPGIHHLFLSAAVLAVVAGPATGVKSAFAENPDKKPPKIDLFDRFDDEQSPLQRGILDARDKKWRKNLKLSSDPRCSQLVRVWAKDPGADETNKTIGRHCVDTDEYGQQVYIGQTACLDRYCGAENQTCAMALINGSGIEDACTPSMSGVLTVSEVDEALECASEIFEKKGGANNRVEECLEDPFKNDCSDDDPDCIPELKPNCKNVFKACSDVPFLRKSEKKAGGSGEITDDHGRKIGKRIQTTTVIQYDHAKQRGKAGAQQQDNGGWDPIQIRDSRSETKRHGVPGEPKPAGDDDNALARRRVVGAGTLNAGCDPICLCEENDDGDCVDTVTGEHYDESQCFEFDVVCDRLRNTLAWVQPCPSGSPFDICCQHVGVPGLIEGTGRMFYGDDCLLDPEDEDCGQPGSPDCELRTTLVQLVDEDPLDDELNNDGDCLNDSGYVTSDCLDATGQLRSNYTWNYDEEAAGGTECPNGENEDNDCMGESGRIGMLQGGECVDENGIIIGNDEGTDFVALIDEDCADDVDNDDDGVSGEDPPGVEDFAPLDGLTRDREACQAYYAKVGAEAGVELDADYDEEHGCNMTRAMRVHVNSKLKKDEDKLDKFKKKTKKEKVFDVDDRGYWCGDPEADPSQCPADEGKRGVVHPTNVHNPRGGKPDRSYKYEEQEVIVDEVFGVKCKPVKDKTTHEWIPTYYDDETGNCVLPDTGAKSYALAALTTNTEYHQAMMGFTFAPPVLEWGWRIRSEVCIFGFCFEIFYARVGYEFDLAAGIRLPVEIQFDDVPESILATHDFTVNTGLEPLDFDASQYTDFCTLHDLDAPWYIANCGDRFAFPDFLDATDGDEFVAQYSIFAGLIVRLFSIPLINWGIDSGVDVPAMCTAWKMKDGIEGMSVADMLKLELGLLDPDSNVLETLKDNFGNCGSFTTPWGYDPCEAGDPGCTLNSPYKRLRAWPFLNLSKHIRADCYDAMREGEVVTVKGKKRPICTALTLGCAGASLGVGLTVEANAGSELITADWSTQGDAAPVDPTELEYTETRWDPPETQPITVTVDNYANGGGGAHQDDALIVLDDFTYYLNAIEIALSANLEFGGILSPIPDIGSFTLFTFAFSTGKFGIPIPQHPNTEPVTVDVLVENYALTTDVRPDSAVEVEPGCELDPSGLGDPCPDYGVWVTNIGSFPDSFYNFAYQLSNRQVVAGCDPSFGIDPNNDHDCRVEGERRRGNPFDGIADDCYDACGNPLPEVITESNEDPPGCPDPGADNQCSAAESDEDGDGFVDEDGLDDDWAAAWHDGAQIVPVPTVEDVAAHTEVAEPLALRVSPLRHSFTSPGIYPFRVTADSVGAYVNLLPAMGPGNDPSKYWFYRFGAPDIGSLEVLTFYDPRIQVLPEAASVWPGVSQPFTVEVINGANTDDSIDVVTDLLDFNQAACTLTTLGSDADCPFRAVPTVIQTEWIVGELPDHFPTDDAGGLMAPSRYDSSDFAIQVPRDWAGMEDTTYFFELTASSTQDPGEPKASNTFPVQYEVQATKESMTRYIGHEIDELTAEIEEANAQGVQTKGLLPMVVHPVTMQNDRALELILAGKLQQASNAQAAAMRIMQGFLHALEGGGKIPEPWLSDWRDRGEAMVFDLEQASECTVPSIP